MPTLAANEITLLTKDGAVHDRIQLRTAEPPQVIIWGAFDATKVFVRNKKGEYVQASHAYAPMPPHRNVQGW